MSEMLDWLQDAYPLSAAQRKALEPHMGNWMKVHAYLASLRHVDDVAHAAKQMLVYELENAQREQIVFRLYRKLAAARRQAEERTLFKMVRS